jgi:FMN phosphatase YigB (HAD superfamily)
MFKTALAMADAVPDEAVMVGNSEQKDITPARELGMRTIRVCVEEPCALDSVADAVVMSLSEVQEQLVTWTEPS